jgi:hypothetical protein
MAGFHLPFFLACFLRASAALAGISSCRSSGRAAMPFIPLFLTTFPTDGCEVLAESPAGCPQGSSGKSDRTLAPARTVARKNARRGRLY